MFNSIINRYKNIDKYTKIAFLITIIFGIIFSIFSVIQYFSLGDSAYDLGINAQELYSFIHTGSFYTPLLNENLLVQHFTLFKYIQVPIYFLFPSPIALMVFEDIFIALAGFLVYLISIQILSHYITNKKYLILLSLLLTLAFEVSPFTQSLVYFPFHNMAFLPFFFLLAMYGFYTEKKIIHIISIAFIISLHASFVYIVAMMLIYEFIFIRISGYEIKHWLSNKYDAKSIYSSFYFIAFLIILYLYLILAGYAKLYIAGVPTLNLVPSTGESGVAAMSPIGLFLLLFKNPGKLFSMVDSYLYFKIYYITTLLRPTAYISFLSPLSFIMAIPYMLYALPSSYTSYYQIGYQYSALIIGAVAIAGIMGIANLLKIVKYLKDKKIKHWYFNYKKDVENNTVKAITIIIAISILLLVPYGILAPGEVHGYASYDNTMNSIFCLHVTPDSTYLIHESKNMSGNAYILTQNNLMPYFSNHINIYAAPYTPGYYNNISMYQYIVVQNSSIWAKFNGNNSLNNIANESIENGTFKVVSKFNGIDILENTKYLN
jgi:uncharacterized membrane protein